MRDKGLMEHLKDIKDGIVDCYIGPYDFGDFLARISGFRDWQEKSVILDDFHKRQTLEELDFLKDIVKNETSRNIILEYLIKDINERPLYYLAPSGILTTIKKITKTKKLFIINITSLGGKATSTAHSLYPYYKNIQNSFAPLCSIDNKNSNLLKEFNFDSFSCNFYNNNIFNQSLKYLDNIQDEKEYINEYKIFLENLNHFNQEYNNYKLMSIQVINNLKIAYIQKLSLEDINNINIDSKPYLLKALYFCEDYVLYDKDKQALFDENTIKELEFNSSFYTIFISHKNKLNDTYLNARKELYKSIDEFKRLGFKDLEHAYQTYMSSFTINEELNNKDKTINKNENKEINKNLNQKSNIKESINFKELSLNLNQENNTKESIDTIIKNTNFNNETSLKIKQSNIIIDDIKEDFKIVSNNATINNTNFKGKKIA
ncbi:hypothetical protein [Campylobacter subantarcticus]|uniref:Uncharacterized protein n=1 Tax=Campylobacter subantarcticus LMG 24374 TaxID=1388751 RepID=A0A0A8HD66_9BACT|nr:hypothetical protein [Campylobacter subantarcticus]AJC90869.1 hypothetical protein CSUB8521_1033 [Campylobacter subantarcticus LMG 24374]